MHKGEAPVEDEFAELAWRIDREPNPEARYILLLLLALTVAVRDYDVPAINLALEWIGEALGAMDPRSQHD